MSKLEIIDLHVTVENKEIIKGVNLKVEEGDVIAILGPNGSGKTTLALALLGHPKYKITKGKIVLDGEDITNLEIYERARRGLYLGFQFPPELPGITIKELFHWLLSIKDGKDVAPVITPMIEEKIIKTVGQAFNQAGLDIQFLERDVNVGFSGGERKKFEVARALIQKPKVAIYDEPDSGVDVEALDKIAEAIRYLAKTGTSTIVISHYRRILRKIMPNKVFVMYNGKIIASGGCELVRLIEDKGFSEVVKKYGN